MALPQVHWGTDDGAGTTHRGSREACSYPSCAARRDMAAKLTEGISGALRDHDMPGAVAMLKLLAVTDPVQAQAVLDAIHLGLALSGTSAADGTMGA